MVQAVVQTTVTGLQGHPVTATAPTSGQSLTWSGSAWAGSGPFLPVAGGTLTGFLTVSANNATINFRDTATGVTVGGLWRQVCAGGGLFIQANTAAAGDFSSVSTVFQLNANGSATVTGPVTVAAAGYGIQIPSGGISLGGALNANGASTVGGSGITYPGTGQTHFHAFAWTGSTVAVFVDGSNIGGMQIAGSDASLKQNFAAMSVDPLAVLDKITLQQFDWLPETLGGETYQKPHWTCGFTAQDLQPLIPEAVIPALGSGPLGVDMLPLIGYLIGAVQQLSARVGALDGKTA